MKYSELKNGLIISGLVFDCEVKIIKVDYQKTIVGEFAKIIYERPNGVTGTEIVYQDKLIKLSVRKNEERKRFSADGKISKMIIEAQRIEWAYLFDPYIAMHTSEVEPLPHQIEAVYGELLKRKPLRYLLADDPGAGKTIMTGLFIKELIIRGDLERCLIVCPGSLCEQWQDEMYSRFGITFNICNNQAMEESVRGNVFFDKPLSIASIDKLARDDNSKKLLAETDWDLIVCDEAHKMSAHFYGKKIEKTKRYQLGELLSDITRHFLLLTATPHNGIEADFQLFMRLLDKDQFDRNPGNEIVNMDFKHIMRRMVKEDLLRFDGTKLFPERIAETRPFALATQEKQLYDQVTNYVQNQFNLAENLNKQRKGNIGFALTILQRRLASSPMAIYKSLKRRLRHLEKQLKEVLENKSNAIVDDSAFSGYDNLYDYLDELDESQQEIVEDEILDRSTAAQSIPELEREISILNELTEKALMVLKSDCDQKWKELSDLLQSNKMKDENGEYRKIIIFSEHKDTIDYIFQRIIKLFGSENVVVKITGGMRRKDRRATESEFTHNKDVRILVATDAAGEGINLQRANLMVNYDLPWNPNRIEQRFGRIHRIGQTRTCHLWNLLASETREGAVFNRLFQKLQQEQASLGGSVFDVLGKLRFEDKSGEEVTLEKLLEEAIRSDNSRSAFEDIERRVESALNIEKLHKYIEDDMLATSTMDLSKVMRVMRQIEIAEARKLQPHYIYQFFFSAFNHLGGKMKKRGNSRFEILKIPQSITRHLSTSFLGSTIPIKYERICFEKKNVRIDGLPNAELIHPGHELMKGIIKEIFDRYRDVLSNGTVLIDESEESYDVRTLYYVQSDINDATTDKHGQQRQASRRLQFIEIDKYGNSVDAGMAPYLDYTAASESQHTWIKDNINIIWPDADFESEIEIYSINKLVPDHLKDIQDIRNENVGKTRQAVEKRLKSEIRRQDNLLAKAREEKRAGIKGAEGRISQTIDRIADLTLRLDRRLKELDRQKALSPLPPRVLGCALIVPKCLFESQRGHSISPDIEARKRIELMGMDAVMQLENYLGFIPEDVSAKNCGYDIRSYTEESGNVKFVEVKARTIEADYITVTPNEHLTALNKPDSFYLAIVKVDGSTRDVIYLKEPFENILDETVKSINFNIADLIKNATEKQEWSITSHGIQKKAN
jgi:superfamily II DNA or RNA helicase